MSMQDPVSDMIVRIKNAQLVEKTKISMPGSKIKQSIADVLKEEGYINNAEMSLEDQKPILTLELKYYNDTPVIEMLERVSKPSRRIYRTKNELPTVKNDLGIAIVSTSKGVMSNIKARSHGVGGEIICYVS